MSGPQSSVASQHAHITSINGLLEQQAGQDLLRFITCGSVDDGKSTLVGRLLWDSQQVFQDQIVALRADSMRFGTQGDEIDFALLVDGLSAEREQGITIDVAYRFFMSARRRFIVADTPGHEQYTRNMATGASTADLAVLLIDARKGLLSQTRRHAHLVSLMGLKQVVLAINKMDLMEFRQDVYQDIREAFDDFAKHLGFASITAIPISALKGENVTQRSRQMSWYTGPTLIDCLETAPARRPMADRLVFPVQWINRSHADFRGVCGTIAEGELKCGDSLRVVVSGQQAKVAQILTMHGSANSATCDDPVTICLDREIDISRGDVLALADLPLETTDQFEAVVIWMSDDPGLLGRNYEIKLATQTAVASMTSLKYRFDVDTLSQRPARSLKLNDIAVCNFTVNRLLVFDNYERSRTLGSFILVDRENHATVGAGMIRSSLRRAQNVHWQNLLVTRALREDLNGHRARVVWFTGLSGSGKSTLANALESALHAKGLRTYILDGDNIRQGLNKDLGFTDADRVENIRRIAEVARLMMDAGLIVLTAFISPFRREREMARELIGSENFFEVYVNTPLEICEQRDPKGLYRKARKGEIPNMTGINSPYEPPKHPDFIADGSSASVNSATNELLTAVLADRPQPRN